MLGMTKLWAWLYKFQNQTQLANMLELGDWSRTIQLIKKYPTINQTLECKELQELYKVDTIWPSMPKQ